jgi:sulfite reductase alpha subunit-like flavoprotein
MTLQNVYQLPRLRPRYYSISSSSAATPNTLAITALLLQEGPPATRPPTAEGAGAGEEGEGFEGVCTGHLARQGRNSEKVRALA